jgi:hypothetical protein
MWHSEVKEHCSGDEVTSVCNDATGITVLVIRKLIWLQFRRRLVMFFSESVSLDAVKNCFYSQLQHLSWEWMYLDSRCYRTDIMRLHRTGLPTSRLFERRLAVFASFEFSEHCCWFSFDCQAESEDVWKFWMSENCALQLAKRRMKIVRRSKYLLAGWYRIRRLDGPERIL